MSAYVRQLRALAWLMFMNARRRAMRVGEAPQRGIPKYLVFMSVTWLYLGGFFYTQGTHIAELHEGRVSALRLIAWGLLGFATGSAIMLSAPQFGRVRTPLRMAWLDQLPLGLSVRPTVVWLQGASYIALGLAILYPAVPEAHDVAGLSFIVALSVLGSVAGSLVGQALFTALRVLGARQAQRIFPWLSLLVLFAPFILLLNAPTLGPKLSDVGGDPLLVVARALMGEADRGMVVLGYLVVVVLGVLALYACERIGYDRDDQPVTQRYTGGASGSPLRVELRLLWRQGVAKVHLINMVLICGLVVVTMRMVLTVKAKTAADFRVLLVTIIVQIVLFGGLMAFTTAAASIARDLAARPLLSALPTTPARTLSSKANALRVLSLPLWLGLLVVAGGLGWRAAAIGYSATAGAVARVVLMGVGLWLVCGIAPAVSFLTRGLGSQGARAGMPSFIVNVLVFMPIVAIAIVPTWMQAVAALGLLAALSFEAQRAAAKCVSWIDDSGDVERDTPVWRALLALGAFFAAQSVAGQALSFFEIDDAVKQAVVYLAGGATLAILTWRARPQVPARERSILWDAGGLAAGVASGGLALLMLLALKHFGYEDHEPSVDSLVGKIALLIAVAVIAPLCEELFFRGWLQAAIARDLGERRVWAPVLGALAFAGVHVGSALVPQLVLGLVAGVLFARTGRLRPGILAHVAHNAVVVLLGAA